MSNVEDFPIKTTGQETPERMLEAFKKVENLQDILIIGIDSSDNISIAGSNGNVLYNIGMLEYAKTNIITGQYD